GAFFQAAETALHGTIERALDDDLDKTLSVTAKLAALNLPEATLVQANELLAKFKGQDGSEELDAWYETVMALLVELDKKSIPPFLASKHNPRCSIIDVFNYGDFFFNETLRNFAANYEVILAGQEAKIDQVQKQVAENPQLKEKAAPFLARLNRDKAQLIGTKANYDKAERFFAHFRDAMVLVGPVDPMLQDLAPTPFDDNPVPKVGVHGNLIKTLLTGKYLQRPADWVEYAGIFGLGLLMIFLGFHSGPLSNWARPFGIALQVIYLVVAFLAFKNGHWVLPVAGPIGAALSTSFAVFAVKLVIEEKAKGRIKGMFGTYVSQELVDQMIDSGDEPSLGGEETQITAFFSDVQSFSSFSELLTPNQLVALMNEYLTAMTDLVQEERGTLDKYIGDAIVAMYGAPIPMEDHAYQAVRTALLMQERQLELREKWKTEGDKWPDIVSLMQTRIGCNTGTATVGNMGSTDRFNYTMMGDMVNLAARCESGAKSYGVCNMVTEETKVAAEATKDDVVYRYLDKIVVKGRTQPVSMHEPIGFKDNLAQETQDCLDCFRQG
ncbi:MAG: adenylate/guanylate cyclase domain-containing protein, partial [Opitutales bacterium]